MEKQDKTFNQAVKDMRTHRLTIQTDEELRDQVLQILPVVQQAIQDGRSIASAVQPYFPNKIEQQIMMMICQSAWLRVMLDRSLKDGFLSEAQHKELVQFVNDLMCQTK